MYKQFFLSLLILSSLFVSGAFANKEANITKVFNKEANVTIINPTMTKINLELKEKEKKEKEALEKARKDKKIADERKKREEKIALISEKIQEIDKELNENRWYRGYENYRTYRDIESKIKKLQAIEQIEEKKQRRYKKKEDSNASKSLSERKIEIQSLQNQLELLNEFAQEPFYELTHPEKIPELLEIESPFDMIEGYSQRKSISNQKDIYKDKIKSIKDLVQLLQNKKRLLKNIGVIESTKINTNKIKILENKLNYIRAISNNVLKKTEKIYASNIDSAILKIDNGITNQTKKLINIGFTVGVIILFSLLFKYLATRAITDNERSYMANKIINFINVLFITIVLIFSFIGDATYLVTVLGFASAGIAIAMKDLFMSTLGWMVIVFGGSFHVGDRIKVVKGSNVYVGDIVDISLLRMTLLEDVTLTTYELNRRAGRIIFVPNNYIFTDLIANYTHGKIKTVWDGVDVTITFDSNHKKAVHLVKEVVKKYSKGYTDISRKQLNLLRSQYSLKNINVEPRIFTFLEENGIKVSCWYMTNSYATLTLRSNIYANIIDAINAADDIQIAFPTQVVNIKKDKGIVPPKDIGEESLS